MQYDETTPDGLQMVFTTNVAGHYIMVRQLGKVPAIVSGIRYQVFLFYLGNR